VPLKSSEVWVPDLYFLNSLTESYGSYLVELYPNGDIYMSVHFKHSFTCLMNFAQMPFDEQVCSIDILSYSEDASKVQLSAKDGIGIQIAEGGAYIPSWNISGTSIGFHMTTYGTGDNVLRWHSMNIGVTIERSSGYHIMNDVLYGVLFVFMSWTGFFVNRSNAPARVAMSLLPVLTMLNHITGIQQQLPRISDLTWLSLFLLVSLVFNVIAVLEYGLVSWLLSVEDRRAERLRTLRVLSTHLGEAYVTQQLTRKSTRMLTTASDASLPGPQDDGDDSEQCRAELGRAFSSDSIIDVSVLLPVQRAMVEDSLKVFDPQLTGFVTAKNMRSGLRQFNIYYSAEQISEIFRKMGQKEHESMPRDKFIKYLKSMPEPSPTMQRDFWGQSPSLIVDKSMRNAFIVSYLMTLLIMFPAVGRFGGHSL
jgi:hypothetical protein